MFKKITLVTAFIALLLTGLYAITLLKNRGSKQPVLQDETINQNAPEGELFLPVKNSNTPLLVPNFFSAKTKVQPKEMITDTVSGSKTALLKEEADYSLYAFSGDDGSSFMVALHADNLRQARLDGERALQELLGIDSGEVCNTNITVVVESPYNENISVSDVRPSFCPGRADLPESGASNFSPKSVQPDALPDVSL